MKLRQPIDLRTGDFQLYFMSDLHYNHDNVRRLSKRVQFSGLGDMNSFIEETLKNTVKPGDYVFDLGDMLWRTDPGLSKKFLECINTQNLFKVMGNHDKYLMYRGTQKPLADKFKLVCDELEIQVIDKDGTKYYVVLSHYPYLDWNGKFRGSIMVHGHCHGNIDRINESSKDLRVDIGFDTILSHECGSFIVPFSAIIDHLHKKTGGQSFNEWAKQLIEELHNED